MPSCFSCRQKKRMPSVAEQQHSPIESATSSLDSMGESIVCSVVLTPRSFFPNASSSTNYSYAGSTPRIRDTSSSEPNQILTASVVHTAAPLWSSGEDVAYCTTVKEEPAKESAANAAKEGATKEAKKDALELHDEGIATFSSWTEETESRRSRRVRFSPCEEGKTDSQTTDAASSGFNATDSTIGGTPDIIPGESDMPAISTNLQGSWGSSAAKLPLQRSASKWWWPWNYHALSFLGVCQFSANEVVQEEILM